MFIRRTRILTAAAASAATLVIGPPLASAAPPLAAPVATQAAAAPELAFSVPAIGTIEIGPGGVPGGSFQQTLVTARPDTASSVTFTVTNPASWYYQYAYRYVSVSWRNLATGAAGTVALRHWNRPDFTVSGYPATLPTATTAHTGAGPVIATVTVLREQYDSTVTSSIIPGLNTLLLP